MESSKYIWKPNKRTNCDKKACNLLWLATLWAIKDILESMIRKSDLFDTSRLVSLSEMNLLIIHDQCSGVIEGFRKATKPLIQQDILAIHSQPAIL